MIDEQLLKFHRRAIEESKHELINSALMEDKDSESKLHLMRAAENIIDLYLKNLDKILQDNK